MKKQTVINANGLSAETLSEMLKGLIEQGKLSGHPQIKRYLDLLENTSSFVHIETPSSGLPRIEDPSIGIITHAVSDSLIWRMSSFVYQYPSTCEHVPFHASMIRRGHGKIFINPRLIFTYGG